MSAGKDKNMETNIEKSGNTSQPMDTEQILRVIDAISQSSLSEFRYEGDGVKFSMKKTKKHGAGKRAVEPEWPSSDPQEEIPDTADLVKDDEANPPALAGKVVKSPLVGTFYAAPAEDADDFVKIGDFVEKGQVLAIVEAMKLMNEIESDFSGKIAEILVQNGEAVEYGQPLFVIQ